jgi:hypothetical protein
MESDRPLHQPMVAWEKVHGKQLEVIFGKQQCIPTIFKLHPYEGKGMCGALPCITNKEK